MDMHVLLFADPVGQHERTILYFCMAASLLWWLRDPRAHWLDAQLRATQTSRHRQLNRPILLQRVWLPASTLHLWLNQLVR